MKSRLRSGLLCSCLGLALPIWAQNTPASAPAPAPAPAPSQPKIYDRDTGGDAFSIEPFFWFTRNSPSLGLGVKSKTTTVDPSGNIIYAQTENGDLGGLGKSKWAGGGILTFPTGSENSLQVSYFRVQGNENQTLGVDSVLLGNPFYAGDSLNTSYKLQDMKLSWNYLTFPHPSKGAKLRIKTLWEIQYVTIHSVIDAPLDVNTAAVDSSKKVFLPTLGLGIEYHAGKHLRLEAKASGFGLPKRSDIWDAEASAVYHSGRLEAMVGGKAFHFKTSPKDDQYFSDTIYGPYLGVRWIWR